MAKLIVIALALTALVAFASAQTTIVTTTIQDESPTSQQQQQTQCSQQLHEQRFTKCQTYLQHGPMSPHENPIQQCCEELQNIDEQCQCAAMQQTIDDVQREHLIQGRLLQLVQQIQQMKQMAQNIPNRCNPEMKQRRCIIGSVFATGSQCQSYILQELQIGSPKTVLTSINTQENQQSQELEQCCNAFQDAPAEWPEDWQCMAINAAYGLANLQPDVKPEDTWQVVRNLHNKCHLQKPNCPFADWI